MLSPNARQKPPSELLGLSEAQKRALALADNKIAANAGWDRERLAIELPELAELLIKENLDISVTGFGPAEIDQLQIDFEEDSEDPDDEIDQGWQTGPLISKRGGLWILDRHRPFCGDARSEADLDRLMGSDRAAMAFLDVPYNVRVRSVSGRGRTKHPEFAFASGEMSRPEYVEFLTSALENCDGGRPLARQTYDHAHDISMNFGDFDKNPCPCCPLYQSAWNFASICAPRDAVFSHHPRPKIANYVTFITVSVCLAS